MSREERERTRKLLSGTSKLIQSCSPPSHQQPTPRLEIQPTVRVRVDFLVEGATEGTEDFTREGCLQYVNIPANDGTSAQFDDVDADRNRHGPRPRIRVKFSVPGVRQFTIVSEVEWGRDDPYQATGHRDTDNELARNAKFAHVPLNATYVTGEDGTFVVPDGAFVLSRRRAAIASWFTSRAMGSKRRRARSSRRGGSSRSS